jgi:hypothetical protein
VGTHMQALLPKLGWPEARRASCSGRPAAFLFRRCYSDSESWNFNRLHLISLARPEAPARLARLHDRAERYHAAASGVSMRSFSTSTGRRVRRAAVL